MLAVDLGQGVQAMGERGRERVDLLDVLQLRNRRGLRNGRPAPHAVARAILKVDNTSFVPYNEKRNSVRIESTDFFPVGSVILFDATHLPYGCSVWPSFWTSGVNWPSQGEIDILEGINLNTANQMAIHTGSGCTQSGTDCSASAGCTTGEKADKSYGDAFSNAGGGVWATQFDTTGIK